MKRYNIIEVANTHGGNPDYVFALLKEFNDIDKKEHTGIKFQPFHYDGIALKDFEYYPVYQNLYFSPQQWKEIIDISNVTKEVWLDIFDKYGTQIFELNFKHRYSKIVRL